MGSYCGAHLALAIRLYSPNVKDGEVSVKLEEVNSVVRCDYCDAPAEFSVNYITK